MVVDIIFTLFQVEMTGLTGTIKFDQHGLRTDFTLEIVELKKDGLNKVGTWNENTGVNFTRKRK
jgi:ionotropic glutamate receptor